MKHILYFLATLMLSATLQAQNVQTTSLTWNATSTFRATTGDLINENTVVTSSPTKVLWKNADGTVRYDMTITETVGSWPNVSTAGSVNFEVNYTGGGGTVQFIRDTSGVRVRLSLVTAAATETFELTIATILQN